MYVPVNEDILHRLDSREDNIARCIKMESCLFSFLKEVISEMSFFFQFYDPTLIYIIPISPWSNSNYWVS